MSLFAALFPFGEFFSGAFVLEVGGTAVMASLVLDRERLYPWMLSHVLRELIYWYCQNVSVLVNI